MDLWKNDLAGVFWLKEEEENDCREGDEPARAMVVLFGGCS